MTIDSFIKLAEEMPVIKSSYLKNRDGAVRAVEILIDKGYDWKAISVFFNKHKVDNGVSLHTARKHYKLGRIVED